MQVIKYLTCVKIHNILKLSSLFAKFLYQHKLLNLPGIGVFSIDSSVAIPEITAKNYHEFMNYVRYDQKAIVKPDEEFIDFIRAQTGKIKPLAKSDLESFLSEGKILLNMGKPFHLDGIGTLHKIKDGVYEFHPGLPLLDRLENFLAEKDNKPDNKAQPFEQDYSTQSKNNNSGRIIWIVLAILVGLSAIIWGGYSLYNNNTNNQGAEANYSNPMETPTPNADTMQNSRIDSATSNPDTSSLVNVVVPLTKPYKFIFRTARNKNYVINRFNDLKLSTPNLYWDTRDSVTYRLYLSITAVPQDTTHIRDSLQMWYGTKKVIIEQ